MTTDDPFRDPKTGRLLKGAKLGAKPKQHSGQFKPGHKGTNQPDDDPHIIAPPTDFDVAIIEAATAFGTARKPKQGLAGYCASLRDNRPVEFAGLLKSALARRTADVAAAAVGISSIEFVVAPSGMFLPHDQAREEWGRRTGFSLAEPPPRPTLALIDTDTLDDPDDAA